MMSEETATIRDWRHVRNGRVIPAAHYCDQPYIVKTGDGAWLCAVTTGTGREGAPGQHIITMRSADCGGTWSEPVAPEPPDGPEASYAVLLKVPGGRVYCFYNHNTDNIREVRADDPPFKSGICKRVDSLGHFVFKYSDDHGRTWSPARYDIPVREMEIDRKNIYGGKVRFFWNVGRPFIYGNAAFVSLHKVGGFGEGFFTGSEGVLLKSENIMRESDPEKIRWETLPDGDSGLRAPKGGGLISEEQSYTVLSDGSFCCVYRTVDGHPAESYSRDGGHMWTGPRYRQYADRRLIKHPRAANFNWKCENGRYLYWFHNHGGKGYEDRNPVWICAGVEADGEDGRIINWSQPEILLYDDDPYIRMSYPDLVEEGGKVYITETQKNVARVHEIDGNFLKKLFYQFETCEVCRDGLLLNKVCKDTDDVTVTDADNDSIIMPILPLFNNRDNQKKDYGKMDLRTGFSVDIWINNCNHSTNEGTGSTGSTGSTESKSKGIAQSTGSHDSFGTPGTSGTGTLGTPDRTGIPGTWEEGQVLFDSRNADEAGILIKSDTNRTVSVTISDGRCINSWRSDAGMIDENSLHHIIITVDAGPGIITCIIDGKLCDGGTDRQFGWGRFSRDLRHANGAKKARLACGSPNLAYSRHNGLNIRIKSLRIYGRPLTTTESIGNFRAGI